MGKKIATKKLNLDKTTLRRIDDGELSEVNGGSRWPHPPKSYSCVPCGSKACLPPKTIVQLP